MRIFFASALLFVSLPALAQDADMLYRQACGPKDAGFVVEHVKEQAVTTPAAGKALVYVIQKQSSMGIVSRIGLDGAWGGVIAGNSYVPLSVDPGEHHLCAATQSRSRPEPEFLHFKAEAGKVYFYILRVSAADTGNGFLMTLEPLDRDEALYLLASDPKSVAKPKP